jgi:hypothetical protein
MFFIYLVVDWPKFSLESNHIKKGGARNAKNQQSFGRRSTKYQAMKGIKNLPNKEQLL